ncbi:MAG: hypothetical protein ACI90V_010970 [Bacillariaceae sp.]|jgi:hypothetical protein
MIISLTHNKNNEGIKLVDDMSVKINDGAFFIYHYGKSKGGAFLLV